MGSVCKVGVNKLVTNMNLNWFREFFFMGSKLYRTWVAGCRKTKINLSDCFLMLKVDFEIYSKADITFSKSNFSFCKIVPQSEHSPLGLK